MGRAFSLALLCCCLVAGCSKDAAAPAPTAQELPVSLEINEFLAQGLSDHGYESQIEGQWVMLRGSAIRMNGHLVEGERDRDMSLVNMHIRLQLPDGRLVQQQVAGWGKDRHEAISHAQASFVLGSFHALIGAFIDPIEEHVQQLELTINGRPRIATFGSVVTKTVGADQPAERGWQKAFYDALEQSNLPPGAHWIDLYHAQMPNDATLEILLNNQRWSEMEQKMKAATWPRGGAMTSVRQFVVIQDADDPTRPRSRPTTRPTTVPAS